MLLRFGLAIDLEEAKPCDCGAKILKWKDLTTYEKERFIVVLREIYDEVILVT